MVAIYCRESTDKQDITTLISMCEKEAKKLGFNHWEVYKDIESGYSNTRANYLRLLNDIKEKKIKNLILYESSRLTRDELEHQIFYRLLKQNDVKLYILNRGWIDLNDEDDVFLSGLLNLLDAREGRKTAKRVKDRMEEIAHNGRWTGGPAPLGYDLINKELVINQDNAIIIKEIYKLFLKGKTRNSIAKLFQLEVKRVNRILKNPIYIGKLKFREVPKRNKKVVLNKNYKILDGIHEQIISDEIFCLVQERLKAITRETNKENYIFKNLLYCSCGSKLYLRIRRGQYPQRYYVCSSVCGASIVKEEALVENVLSKLENIIKNINTDKIDNKEKEKSNIKIYEQQLKGVDKKEEVLTRKLLNGTLSETIYDKLMKEIKMQKEFNKNKIESLKKEQRYHSNKKNNKKILLKYFSTIKKEQNPEKLNIFFMAIIDKIEFINDYRFYIHLKF